MKRHFPAEWAPQDAIMLTWPHQATDWAPILDEVEGTYVNLIRILVSSQNVVIVCHNLAVQHHITELLAANQIDGSRIQFVVTPTDDTWSRDHGPISVYQGNRLVALDFTFNGWGNKYSSDQDNKINTALFNQLKNDNRQEITFNFVLEGGAIETDGMGSLLTTEQCVLNPNRNGHVSKTQVEETLSNYLGVDHFLWLSRGALVGDDTDSHIDTLVRFAPNDSLVYVACDDEKDEHFAELYALKQQVMSLRTKQGEPYTLYALPWPQAIFNDDGERLPATYANYLITNTQVIVPVYNDSADDIALDVIANAYPNHTIVPLDCVPLIKQFGSLHCITMQLPKGFIGEHNE